jgi:hypothetical protein
MYNYAQLNGEGICYAVSMLSGEVVADNMIAIDEYDESLLGKRYNRETGEFEEVPPA